MTGAGWPGGWAERNEFKRSGSEFERVRVELKIPVSQLLPGGDRAAGMYGPPPRFSSDVWIAVGAYPSTP